MNAPWIADTEAEGVTVFDLIWPPSDLSGHNSGHWSGKHSAIAQHREWARLATQEAHPIVPEEGDIRLHLHFIPPDNRGDRVNFWNRCKPAIDGIAEALSINDKRFLPCMSFGAPKWPGKVVVTLG